MPYSERQLRPTENTGDRLLALLGIGQVLQCRTGILFRNDCRQDLCNYSTRKVGRRQEHRQRSATPAEITGQITPISTCESSIPTLAAIFISNRNRASDRRDGYSGAYPLPLVSNRYVKIYHNGSTSDDGRKKKREKNRGAHERTPI